MPFRIGVYNIFTAFWCILVMGCGCTLTYVAFVKSLFSSDMMIIVKLFLGLMIIITFAVMAVICYKLQMVIVTGSEIIAIKPFLLSVKRLPFNKINQVKWRLWEVKAVFFKTMEVHSVDQTTIAISDFEFGNFEAIIKKIPRQSSDKKLRIYREQAEMNLSMIYFIMGISGLFILFIVWIAISKGFNLILLIVLGSAVLLMWGGYVRLKRYQRVLGKD